MNSSKSHFPLFLDVFDKQNQRAEVLNNLTPPELIAAAIQEFQELEYLNQPISELCLSRGDTQAVLEATLPIRQQVDPGARLRLREVEKELPAETERPRQDLYLLELDATSTRANKVQWLPAIVGRSDSTKEHNDWVAVDFSDHAAGTRVSRRHLQFDQNDGELCVHLLSNNPATLQRQGGAAEELRLKRRYPVQHGDVLTLSRSRISLRVFICGNSRAEEASDEQEEPLEEERTP